MKPNKADKFKKQVLDCMKTERDEGRLGGRECEICSLWNTCLGVIGFLNKESKKYEHKG